MKLLMAVLMLGMPMFQCEMFAGTIKVNGKSGTVLNDPLSCLNIL